MYIYIGWKTMAFDGGETFKTLRCSVSPRWNRVWVNGASIPSCFRGLSERSQGWHATRKPEPEPHTIDKISEASYYSARRALTARQDRKHAPKIAVSLSADPKFRPNFMKFLVDFLLFGKINKKSRYLLMKNKEAQALFASQESSRSSRFFSRTLGRRY